jgi:hypothetical protein
VSNSPCKDCQDRGLGCHDRCKLYQAFHKANVERCNRQSAESKVLYDNEIRKKKEQRYFKRRKR